MAKPQQFSLRLRDGDTLAKWTRSRGFEVPENLAHVESPDHLMAIAKDFLREPKAKLYQLQYRDGAVKQVSSFIPRWMSISGSCSLKQWVGNYLPTQFKRRGPFDGMPKGCYWQVVIEGQEGFITLDTPVRTKPSRPFRQLRLSHQLALLLHVYGPLMPAVAARGLCVSEPQVKGAAGALVQKGLLLKGREPYTPQEWIQQSASGDSAVIHEPDESMAAWLMDQLGDSLPAWVVAVLHNPDLLRQRVKPPAAAQA